MMNWSHLRDLFGNIQLVCRLQTDNYATAAHLSLLPNQVVDAHVSTIAADSGSLCVLFCKASRSRSFAKSCKNPRRDGTAGVQIINARIVFTFLVSGSFRRHNRLKCTFSLRAFTSSEMVVCVLLKKSMKMNHIFCKYNGNLFSHTTYSF